MSIIIFPAIDLRRGQVVRLRQGDPAAQTVFDDDPAAVARRWVDQGARWLHVVNLDGALAATAEGGSASELPVNLRRLTEIRAAVNVPIQFGGGMRALDEIARALNLGATRVVLGTVAVQHPELVAAALARFGAQRIVVGIDARAGYVATHGWQETSEVAALTVAMKMRALGVVRIVYTDIARDGTLAGANVAATAVLARGAGLKVIASGGVSGLADIRALVAVEEDGIEGVVVGQALYTGALELPSALAAARTGGEIPRQE